MKRQYLDLDATLAEGRRFRREGPAPVTPDRSYLARLEYYVWLRERHDKEVPLDADFNRRLDVYRLPTPKNFCFAVGGLRRASTTLPICPNRGLIAILLLSLIRKIKK